MASESRYRNPPAKDSLANFLMRYSYYNDGATEDTRAAILSLLPDQGLAIEPCPCGSSCLELWSNKAVQMINGEIEIIPGNQFVVRCLVCNLAGGERSTEIRAIEGWNQLPRAIEEVPDVPF